jgi:hypothetical protein
MKVFFKILSQAGASLIFTGHNHFYSRSYPLASDGKRAGRQGIVQFVSGGGGSEKYNHSELDPRKIEAVNIAEYGVLKINFSGNDYHYAFLNISNQVRDQGSGHCTR